MLTRRHTESQEFVDNKAEWVFTEIFRVDGYELFDEAGESLFYQTFETPQPIVTGSHYVLRVAPDGLMERDLIMRCKVRLFQYCWGEAEERLYERKKRFRKKTWKVDWSVNGF